MAEPAGLRLLLVAVGISATIALIALTVVVIVFKEPLAWTDWVVGAVTAAIVGAFFALLLVRKPPGADPRQAITGFKVEGERVFEREVAEAEEPTE